MAIISHKVEGVANDVTHYTRIFPVNKKGHAQSELDGQIASALTNAFPAEPSSYNLIGTYSSSQTFTAPEDGWYQIELFGRSGAGGAASSRTMTENIQYHIASGGGGGGGAYCRSVNVKLNKGDTIVIIIDSTCTVTINSSTGETYEQMLCTTGSNGGSASTASTNATGGTGGAGGTASGGNDANIDGGRGSSGKGTTNVTRAKTMSGGAGGTAGALGGRVGGTGATIKTVVSGAYLVVSKGSAGGAQAGFCKIYRGDTNKAA